MNDVTILTNLIRIYNSVHDFSNNLSRHN